MDPESSPAKPPESPGTATSWIGPLIAWRLGLLFIIFAAIFLLPDLFDRATWKANPHWPEAEEPDLSVHWKTWDAQHYLRIAENGYEPGTKTSAFYPLWPLTVRMAAPLLGGSHLAAGLILANLFGLLACVLLYRLVRKRLGTEVANRSLLLLLAFPGAFFLGLPYSESLFLLLLALFFVGLDDDRLPVAAAAAFLLPICRPTGLLILLPFAVHAIGRMRREGGFTPKWLLAGTPLLGFGAYLGIMAVMAGDPLEGFAAQDRFHTRSSIVRLLDLPGFIKLYFGGAISLHGVTTSLLDRLWILWVVVALPALWRYDRCWFTFALVMGVVPAMTAPIVSFTRYAVVLFPVFVVTAKLLDSRRGRPWAAPLVLGLMGFQVLLMIRHINNMWAG